jgi:hypothetical protein
MAGRRRRCPSWDDVERAVKLLLWLAIEVAKLIIMLRGGR